MPRILPQLDFTSPMGQRSPWRPRKTPTELYSERFETSWYWRLLAVLSASLILLGFLVFPSAFQPDTTIPSQQATLSVAAVVLLAIGFSLSVALWFICTSWLFQFDVLFTPCLFSCLLGTLNVAIALGVHPETKGQWNTASISALSLGLISSTVYGALSLLLYAKVTATLNSEKRGHGRADSEINNLLPENELQRQNLERLLLQKEGDRSNLAVVQTTYRIDIPDRAKISRGSSPVDQQLSNPSTPYQGRGRSNTAGSLNYDAPYALHQPATANPVQLALEQARLRTQHNRSRNPSDTPPVIVNSRNPDDIADIPLDERHPLERSGLFIRGAAPKDSVYPLNGVYRPEDHAD